MSHPTSKTNVAFRQGEPTLDDEAVPSYEAALKQGAGGGIQPALQPVASSSASPQPYTYGTSPYTADGTTRIIILPATAVREQAASPHDALLPAPVTMQQSGRRARPRFFSALMHAVLIYILINLLLDVVFAPKK